ncbi:hypothetical protein [Actinocrispum wychmicini]|uniref:PcfJ-like protein n=1 Tax=Actinocrispum wychmicini TaxID=1213861 RepID=A0A4R2JT48_9PSEU|nr:hypothetical protein [Actinocrispum wychmicini]TCO62804.1 hypothetical protein EV192_102943 [Actinocrispum wychmicini]
MPRPIDDRVGAHPPGSAVAVGPADAEPAVLQEASRQLTLLVIDGTEAAAGAGVDLGGGFTSARLAGAHGDRRDAVLAALRVLGVNGAHRLGDRTGSLVALFGPSATKRVGAAANTAIAEQRWAALQLASAASDLLGPEQLERLLALRAPDGIDPFPRGAASTLSGHLSRVLESCQRPRRLALIISLWDHVCARLVERRRLDRLPSGQTRADRIGKLRDRHRDHFDELILRQLTHAVGRPTLAAAARWLPPPWWTARELSDLLHDAIAATALLRFARTFSDDGLAAAAAKHHSELVAADACLTDNERTAAARRPEGAYSHPARPGCYVHQLVQRLPPEHEITPRTEIHVRERVGMARNYGVVVFDAVTRFVSYLDQPLHNCWDTCKPWQAAELRQWRAAAGFSRAPGSWEQPPLSDAHADSPTQTLAQRLAAVPAADPASVEAPHDLLWLADLADALAPFYGNESATAGHARPAPDLDYDPPAPDRPLADSVPLAVAEVAQLVAFGATPPPRCGSWSELVAGVNADAVIAEASVGAFPIPPEVSAVDTQVVPGTALSVELGRDPRQLAEWSGYMGNCIGESWYADQARRGHCVLMALRDKASGRIVANLDIRRRTGGWLIHELRARFNDNLAPALEKHVKQWVNGLTTPVPSAPEPLLPVPPVRSRSGSSRRSAAGRLPADLIVALVSAVERELASAPAVSAQRTYAALARGLGRPGQPADFDPDAAVIALKRVGPTKHVELLHAAMDAGLDLLVLWQATRVRPLAAAVGRLDPEDRLATLTNGSALPRTLRALVRRPEIAPAYAMDAVARAVRAATGELAGSEALARSVARSPSPELVCALAIATTCAPRSTTDNVVQLTAARKIMVPGFPATNLFDEHGPWQHALTAAADLGAPVQLFAERIAEHGLLIPAALLGNGGWPALWRRAHRAGR